MSFLAILFVFLGCWLVIISGRLSGKAIEMENFLVDASLVRIGKYIFTHNPFTGFRRDIRILLFGLSGLLLIFGGFFVAFYFTFIVSTPGSR
jgi:hypothetical protein